MRRGHLLYIGFVLVAIVWLLNTVALTFYFYWTHWWFDYLMHFLGGLSLGVLGLWLFNIQFKSKTGFLILFSAVMITGLGWEVFEYAFDIAGSPQEYTKDTIIDLVMDALGGVVAYLSLTSKKKQLV